MSRLTPLPTRLGGRLWHSSVAAGRNLARRFLDARECGAHVFGGSGRLRDRPLRHVSDALYQRLCRVDSGRDDLLRLPGIQSAVDLSAPYVLPFSFQRLVRRCCGLASSSAPPTRASHCYTRPVASTLPDRRDHQRPRKGVADTLGLLICAHHCATPHTCVGTSTGDSFKDSALRCPAGNAPLKFPRPADGLRAGRGTDARRRGRGGWNGD